jgi:hypothetical protein
MPIIPEFLDKNIMLHVTPKSPSSVYVGMPIQKAFKFNLDQAKIKNLAQNMQKTNVFEKMGISPQKRMQGKQNLNSSFTGIWSRLGGEKAREMETEYSREDSFTERSAKFYLRIATKLVKFKEEIKGQFQVELSLSGQTNMMLFLQQKWELSENLQKKVKTMDEEKNFLQNENKNIQKERKTLNRKNKELVFENNRLKSQNELLLEEKNYFINHKSCFDSLQGVNEHPSLINKSSSINIGKTKANISAIDILTDRNRVSH